MSAESNPELAAGQKRLETEELVAKAWRALPLTNKMKIYEHEPSKPFEHTDDLFARVLSWFVEDDEANLPPLDAMLNMTYERDTGYTDGAGDYFLGRVRCYRARRPRRQRRTAGAGACKKRSDEEGRRFVVELEMEHSALGGKWARAAGQLGKAESTGFAHARRSCVEAVCGGGLAPALAIASRWFGSPVAPSDVALQHDATAHVTVLDFRGPRNTTLRLRYAPGSANCERW